MSVSNNLQIEALTSADCPAVGSPIMSSIVFTVMGFIAAIAAVAFIEFAAAPSKRKGRMAAQAATVTTCILCMLIGLATAYEWLAGPAIVP
jgi:hypothetical protein